MLSFWACRATLVVCAVSLAGQWIDEIESKLGGALRVCQARCPLALNGLWLGSIG